jgi:hypothetical protein
MSIYVMGGATGLVIVYTYWGGGYNSRFTAFLNCVI